MTYSRSSVRILQARAAQWGTCPLPMHLSLSTRWATPLATRPSLGSVAHIFLPSEDGLLTLGTKILPIRPFSHPTCDCLPWESATSSLVPQRFPGDSLEPTPSLRFSSSMGSTNRHKSAWATIQILSRL